MKKVNNSDLADLHRELLKMAKEIHQICVEHDILYTMVAGTMIGAIRNKGFIPWDDDIDLAMTYDNYKKFASVMHRINHPWLEIDYPLENNYRYYIKVYDKNTTFIEEDHQNDVRGVFIDVFPIVFAGDSEKEVNRRTTLCTLCRALLSRKIHTIPNKTKKDYLFKILSYFIPKRFLYRRLILCYEKANKKYRKYSTILFSWDNDAMPSDLYHRVRLYEFEDIKLYGIKDYHFYLSEKYGDYMQLPPQDKQIPHHYKFLDLYMPYARYVDNYKYAK